MGFEIPLDSDYIDHPKTQHLLKLIGPEADIYPIRLWVWASKYARDGQVRTGWRGVEAACRWSGRPKRLSRALVKSGFLETDGHTIHDWMGGVGRAIALYERKKQKQREKYRESVGILPEDLSDPSRIPKEDHRQSSPNPSNPSNPSNPGKAEEEESPPSLEKEEEEPKKSPDLKSPQNGFCYRMAQLWNKHAFGPHINLKSATHQIDQAIRQLVETKRIEEAVFDESLCSGKKIWEVMEILANERPVRQRRREAKSAEKHKRRVGYLKSTIKEIGESKRV